MNNKIQAQVNDWKLYSSYMEVPQALISLYLGPLSGNNISNLSSVQLHHRADNEEIFLDISRYF